jgi:hypothetical protein
MTTAVHYGIRNDQEFPVELVKPMADALMDAGMAVRCHSRWAQGIY